MNNSLFDEIERLRDAEIEGWCCPLEIFLDDLGRTLNSEDPKGDVSWVNRKEGYYHFVYRGVDYYVDYRPDSWNEEIDDILWSTVRGYS